MEVGGRDVGWKIKPGCHLLLFYEAQSDNLLHAIRWVNRPPTTCPARLSEQPLGLMIYSLHSTVTLNLFTLQLPEGSDVFFLPPLCRSCLNAQQWTLTVHDDFMFLLSEGAPRLQIVFSQETKYLSHSLRNAVSKVNMVSVVAQDWTTRQQSNSTSNDPISLREMSIKTAITCKNSVNKSTLSATDWQI